jgi:hypothetical protein
LAALRLGGVVVELLKKVEKGVPVATKIGKTGCGIRAKHSRRNYLGDCVLKLLCWCLGGLSVDMDQEQG